MNQHEVFGRETSSFPGDAVIPVQRGHDRALDLRGASAGFDARLSQTPHDLPVLLSSGGDKRILLLPATGRNRYGTRTIATASELSFASTTASNISVGGYEAAYHALQRLFPLGSSQPHEIDGWFHDIRSRIAVALGCGQSEVILAASGTDVELIAICLMASLSTRSITNILIAPEETGSGVLLAAAGCHYSDSTALGREVVAGSPLDGLAPGHIEVRTIAIRDKAGRRRSADDIDTELLVAVADELKRDRDVLVHVLDTSKTGLTGVTRQAARDAVSLAPERVRVIVDACQLRCTQADLRQDLADGFLVAMTGSKFVAGPPFSGAILLPRPLADRIAGNAVLPAGLQDYTAALDWPPMLRAVASCGHRAKFNLGLGLRWVAALESLTRWAGIDQDLQLLIKTRFVALARSRVECIKSLSIHPDDEGEHLDLKAIVSLTVANAAGACCSFEEARVQQLAMRDAAEGPVCHIGQAVDLGSRTILRLAASIFDVAAVAEGMAEGLSLDDAFRSVEGKLDIVFQKWAAIQCAQH